MFALHFFFFLHFAKPKFERDGGGLVPFCFHFAKKWQLLYRIFWQKRRWLRQVRQTLWQLPFVVRCGFGYWIFCFRGCKSLAGLRRQRLAQQQRTSCEQDIFYFRLHTKSNVATVPDVLSFFRKKISNICKNVAKNRLVLRGTVVGNCLGMCPK